MPSAIVQTVTIAKAELAGFMLEILFYGIFLVLFAGSVYTLFSRYHDREGTASRGFGWWAGIVNKPLWATAFSLFILTTIVCSCFPAPVTMLPDELFNFKHLGLNASRAFDAFIGTTNSEGFSDPSLYYGHLSNWKNVLKTGVFVSIVICGDVFIIYRVYHVWGQSWRAIALPCLLLLGTIITGIGITIQFARLPPGFAEVFGSECGRWITGCFVFSLATNTACAFLISYRIWRGDRIAAALIGTTPGKSRLMPTISIVIESAIIICVWEASTLTLYLAKSNAQFMTLNAGISFMLIIVRVSLGFGYETKGSEGEMSTVRITMPTGHSTAHIDSIGPGADIEFNDVSLTHRSTRETYGTSGKKGPGI